MIDSDHLAAFLNWLRVIQQEYDMALAELDEAENATQDILHQLELGEDGYHNRAKLALALRKARQRRRRAKDRLAVLQPLKNWLAENEKTIKTLERLLGEMRKLEKSLVGRSYHPKTDIVAKTLRKQREAKEDE